MPDPYDESDHARLMAARACFPHAAEGVFLNHAAVGRLSTQSADAISRAAQLMTTIDMPEARAEADRLRIDLGRLIGADPDQVGLTRSTAHALTIVAEGLDWHDGDNVVGVRHEYPANVLPWMALSRRGVEYRQTDPAHGPALVDALMKLSDKRTRVVTISDVAFWSGLRTDVRALADACHERQILLVVDVMQSVGALAVNVHELGADFVAAGDCKWLMGPAGIAFFWASFDLLDRLPPLIWGPGGMADRDEYFDPSATAAPSARRFEESWISMPDIAGMHAAVALSLDTGPDWIQRRVLNLAEQLAQGCAELGCIGGGDWPLSKPRHSGIVSFKREGDSPPAVIDSLRRSGIHGGSRNDLIRLSPHYYNTADEIARTLNALELAFSESGR
jgi:cysteine desulfurase/selenocysteine lyase